MNEKNTIEITELITKLLDKTISNEGFSSLKEQLRQDPEVASLYFDIVNLHFYLNGKHPQLQSDMLPKSSLPDTQQLFREIINDKEKKLFQERLENENKQKKQYQKIAEKKLTEFLSNQQQDNKPEKLHAGISCSSRSNIKKKRQSITAIAACLFIGCCLWVYFTPKSSAEVAKVIESYQAQWKSETPILLHAKEYQLESGLAKIEFKNGAKIILEGPSEIRLESANGVHLSYGRLVAYVSSQALGFTVKTDQAEYIDLGTKFAIQANKDGSSECHVFEGKVQLARERQPHVMIEAGQAKGVAGNGEVLSKTLSHFDLGRQIEDVANLPIKWDRYEKAVLDSGPVGYWCFYDEEPCLKPSKLVVVGGSFKQVELLADCLRTENNNTYLLCDGKKGAVTIQSTTELEKGFTIMFHLRLDHTGPQVIMRQLMSERQNKYSRELILNSDTSFTLTSLVGDDLEEERLKFSTCELVKHKLIKSQQWYHVAYTVSRDWTQQRLFIDGKLLCKSVTGQRNRFESDFNPMSFGSGLHVSDESSMQGAIDNLIVFNKPLSEEDILKIYSSSK